MVLGASRLALLAMVGALYTLGTPAGLGQAEGEVALKAVKYTEMGDIVKKLKGKVVVVDFWADF